jgi:hypothetical protein
MCEFSGIGAHPSHGGTRVNFVKNDDPECTVALPSGKRCWRKLKRSNPANRTDIRAYPSG